MATDVRTPSHLEGIILSQFKILSGAKSPIGREMLHHLPVQNGWFKNVSPSKKSVQESIQHRGIILSQFKNLSSAKSPTGTEMLHHLLVRND